MNRSEIEALLVRFDVVYPSHTADVDRVARVEEWLDSAVAELDAFDAAAAFRDWKDARDWPPTPHQFVDQCRATVRRLRPEPAALREAPLSDEERAVALDQIRRMRASLPVLAGPPADDRPRQRHRSGALVHGKDRP